MKRNGLTDLLLTSAPALIVVFILMLVFVIVSGAISKDYSDDENIASYFVNSYISFNGEVITIKEAIEKNCFEGNAFSLDPNLKKELIKELSERYEGWYSFVLATRSTAHYDINARYFVSFNFGVFDEFGNGDFEILADDFEKIFDIKNKNYYSIGLCEPVRVVLYAKRGGS